MRINKIKGFENVKEGYHIFTCGRVYSEYKGGFLNNCDNGNGYKNVSLKKQAIREWKKVYIHRLVALAFIPNPENKPQINHLNEIKSDNYLSNLEWCTSKENNNYGTKNQRISETVGDTTYVYDFKGEFIKKFTSLSEATREVLGFKETRVMNFRAKDFFFTNYKVLDLKDFLKFQGKTTTLVLEDIQERTKKLFKNHLELKKLFKGKTNITDAIKKGRIVAGRYKIYYYDFNTLKDSPNLQE